MKKTVRRASMLLLALVMLFAGGTALADTGGDQTGRVHFVLVIDCTGSMDEADSEGMSVAAAELFVDMIPMEIISLRTHGELLGDRMVLALLVKMLTVH